MSYFTKYTFSKSFKLGEEKIRRLLTYGKYSDLVEKSSLETMHPHVAHNVWDNVRHSELRINRDTKGQRLILILDGITRGYVDIADRHKEVLTASYGEDEGIQYVLNDYIDKGIVQLMYNHYESNKKLVEYNARYGTIVEKIEILKGEKDLIVEEFLIESEPFQVGDKVEIDKTRNIGGLMEKKEIIIERVIVFVSKVLPKFKGGLPTIEYKFNKCKKDGTESQHGYYSYDSTKETLNIKLIERK